MRRLLFLSLLAVPACVDGQPTTTGSQDQEIVGGETDLGDPAVTIVQIGNGGLCTGTVISPHVVLTAKHCLGQNLKVRFENSFGDGSGPVIDVVQQSGSPDADIAVIAMTDASPTPPIPYNTEDLTSHIGEATRIVGFGVTSENGDDSGLKRQGAATLVDVRFDPGFDYEVIETSNNPQGTCYGDSGGPNFMTLGGVEKVIGVTTSGTDICGSGTDIGSRVDAYATFIQGFINQVDGAATCEADGQCATGCENPDPDCPCADDGLCTNACGDIGTDPDCMGCEADGMCREDCPTPDTDCASEPDGGPSEGDDDGGGGGGCCSAGGDTPGGAIFLGLMVGLGLIGRRRFSRR